MDPDHENAVNANVRQSSTKTLKESNSNIIDEQEEIIQPNDGHNNNNCVKIAFDQSTTGIQIDESSIINSLSTSTNRFSLLNSIISSEDQNRVVLSDIELSGNEESKFTSPSLEESNDWKSWSPRTEDYWSLQYSSNLLKNKMKKQEPQVSTMRKKESLNDINQLSIPMDADHFPTRMMNPNSEPGRDNNNNENLNSEGPPNDRYYYIPFANCNSRPHYIAPDFLDSKFRARFFSKILLVKTIQTATILLLVFEYPLFLPALDFIQKQPNGSGYFALLVFMCVFSCVRCFAAGRTIIGAMLTLIVCILCSATICTAIYYNADPHVVIAVLMNLALSYGALSIVTYSTKVNTSEQGNIFCIGCGIVVLTTAITFTVVIALLNPFAGLPSSTRGSRFTAIGAPAFVVTITLILFQMSEIHQIMSGFRLPLRENDFIVAAAFLI